MPTTTPPLATLTEDSIDDLLYLARTGSTSDLTVDISALTTSFTCPATTILSAAVDPRSGNGLLHMASANGHTGTYNFPIFISLAFEILLTLQQKRSLPSYPSQPPLPPTPIPSTSTFEMILATRPSIGQP